MLSNVVSALLLLVAAAVQVTAAPCSLSDGVRIIELTTTITLVAAETESSAKATALGAQVSVSPINSSNSTTSTTSTTSKTSTTTPSTFLTTTSSSSTKTSSTTTTSSSTSTPSSTTTSTTTSPTTTSTASPTTTPTTASPTTKATTQTTTKATSTTSTTPAPSSPASGSGSLSFVGANIAGFDFGMETSGCSSLSSVYPPLAAYSGIDGAGQMNHFVTDDGFNIFRLPVGWQYLVNNVVGGDLDPTNFAKYDELVQACLDTGAHCIIDIHNYARWENAIIGQGGPTNAQFAGFWNQLAGKYANNAKIVFAVMNEPHDLDINMWAETLQEAVTAIRSVATANLILLPGSNYASAGAMPALSGAALLSVSNPDGSHTGLIFDVHQYLDSDSSGTNPNCVTDAVSNFSNLATFLRTHGRQAMLTETGGGNTASCIQYVCQMMDFLHSNSDVFLGVVVWAAGAFDPSSYPLSAVPVKNGGAWTDGGLVSSCVKR